MKFAVPYFRKEGGKWMEDADEIIILYEDNGEDSLVKFLSEHPNQRIIIDIKNFDAFTANAANPYMLRNLKEVHHLTNWALRINIRAEDISTVEIYMKDYDFSTIDITSGQRKIDYFYNFAVETFEQLDRLLYTTVSDIYITNSLAFDMVRVKKKLDNCELPPKLRVYPNICQSFWSDEMSIRTFFIRPEDVPLYEDYVDVMEIYAETIPQKAKADVYLKIYYHDKTWMGNLKEYLINCKEDINNFYMFKDFGQRRLDCRKRCVSEGRCTFCNDQNEYIKLMEVTMNKISNIDDNLAKEGIVIKDGDSNLEDIRTYIDELPMDKENENEYRDNEI